MLKSTDLKEVRVAMIGSGRHATSSHYPSLASFDDVEIAAACDLDTDRLKTTARKYGVERRYTDYRRMIDETAPDAVYAIGPPNVFYDIWIWCLEQGLNLFIEKPMGLTVHQARMLAYAAKKNGCITQVGFQRRCCPLLISLREKCMRRGPIHLAVSRFYKCAPTPYLDARSHMMDDGVHAIDTLRWMCGGEVLEVQSLAQRIQVPDLNAFSAILRFDNGCTGILLTNWSSGRRIFAVEMHAPGICVEAEIEGKGYLYADGDSSGYDTRQVAGSDSSLDFTGIRAKNREFIDCLKAGEQPSSNFADALKTMEVAGKILAQALMKGI